MDAELFGRFEAAQVGVAVALARTPPAVAERVSVIRGTARWRRRFRWKPSALCEAFDRINPEPAAVKIPFVRRDAARRAASAIRT